MNAWTLIRASLRHHARADLLVAAGAAVGSAVLCGALVVGDSVRSSLARAARARTGRTLAVLDGRERFFREDLARALADAVPGASVAPAIRLEAVVSTSDATRRAGAVQVLGVDERFFALGPGAAPVLASAEAALNERLAATLGAAAGDELVVRLPRPSSMSRDLVLASDEDLVLPLRVRAGARASAGEFGEFALETGSEARASLFVPLAWLQDALGLPGRANLVLASAAPAELQGALREVWQLADAELVLRARETAVELASPRVFLEDALVEALDGAERPWLGVLTYFVNELRAGERATPYSMVAALGALGAVPGADAIERWSAVVPADLAEDEIVVGEWLAGDLGLAAGDALELAYFAVGDLRRLEERRASFRVRAVVAPEGLAGDRTLMPDFPGLGDAEDCSDWDPGIPIDLERIRDVDEQYWDDWRGTPKAFVSLAAGRKLWANRFGSLTAVRAPAGVTKELESFVRARVDPSALGLAFREVASAAGSPTDFGGLFLGLSVFLIASAVLLTALFFALAIDARSSEIGILLALGLSRRSVALVLAGEAALLALVGVLAGAGAGLLYTSLLLRGLEGLWRDAVGRTALELHAGPRTLVLGALLASAAILAAIGLVLARVARRPPLELLLARPAEERPRRARARIAARLALACALLAGLALALAAARADGTRAAGLAFGAAVLVLLGGLGIARELVRGRLATLRARSALALGVSNATRRPARTFATLVLVASAVFLVVAVGGNRARPTPERTPRESGTGGFAFLGRSSLPVLEDLDAFAGREAFALPAADLEGVTIVALRVRDGDEASCLNPNVAASPRIVAASAASLTGRFRFAAHEGSASDPWTLLETVRPDGAIPAIADATSLAWALKKKVGDVLEIQDERGRTVALRIVAALSDSILQGDVVIAERRFVELFPAESGKKAFLVDAPAEQSDHVGRVLTRALSDVGLVLERTNERLDRFHAVQNTYLSIFQWLGGLGLFLGSAGVGVLVLRHALERRGELALARAVGFGGRELRALILGEHGLSLGLGLFLGAGAGLVALVPAFAGGSAAGILRELGLGLLLLAAGGVLWILLAARIALRGFLTEVLRGE